MEEGLLTSPRLYAAGRVESSDGFSCLSVKPTPVSMAVDPSPRHEHTGEMKCSPKVICNVSKVVSRLCGFTPWARNKDVRSSVSRERRSYYTLDTAEHNYVQYGQLVVVSGTSECGVPSKCS